MRLIGREKLRELLGIGEHVEKWVLSWAAEVMNAHWKHPAEIQTQFPNMREGSDGQFVFPVGDCKWAISVFIAFPQGIALVAGLEVNEANEDGYGN